MATKRDNPTTARKASEIYIVPNSSGLIGNIPGRSQVPVGRLK
ncbi:MAG TPA: hypothetical protein VGM18_08355 [Candidatus Sulfotelmatobacter sp.]|jgi:hypothetical protein